LGTTFIFFPPSRASTSTPTSSDPHPISSVNIIFIGVDSEGPRTHLESVRFHFFQFL
jgi:hypothetical protein